MALWVVLVLFALIWGVDNAETTLRDAARHRLSSDGYDVVVDFSGRDALLIGTVESEEIALRIEDSINGLPGVREVNSEILVVPPAVPETRDPEIMVRLIGDAVSVFGLVPDAAVADDLLVAAETQFGKGQVVDALQVADDVESPPWLGRIQDVFAHLGTLRSGGFTAGPGGLVITGEVISEAERDAVLDEVTLVLDDLLPVQADLSVAVLPPPTFSAAGRNDTVTLEGVFPSQEAVDRVTAAAERLHGSATIFNLIRVGDVAGPSWLDSIDGLLDVVTRLDPWTMSIAEGKVTIGGLALDQDLIGAVDVLTEEVVGGQLAIETNVEVDPAAVATELTQLLEGNATFASNGTELSADGIALLDSAIVILEANPSTRLVVEGHTDDQGDAALNKELSQRRAETVVAYLVNGGIAPERLTAIGYGEERPIADNSTDEGRAQNRRIEFVIQEGDG